jgi:hypothetical protein
VLISSLAPARRGRRIHDLEQIDTGDELHRDVEGVVVEACIDRLRDPGMIEERRDPRLRLEQVVGPTRSSPT